MDSIYRSYFVDILSTIDQSVSEIDALLAEEPLSDSDRKMAEALRAILLTTRERRERILNTPRLTRESPWEC